MERFIELYKPFGFYVYAYAHLRASLKLLDFGLDHYSGMLSGKGIFVDIGCGYGLVSNYLALRSPNNKVIGIDNDAKRIEIASKTIGDRDNIQFLNVDAVNWFMTEKCVMVVMSDFLHHVSCEGQKQILKHVYDNLQEDGIVLIAEVDPSASFYKYWQSYCFDRLFYPSPLHFHKPDDWVKMLSEIGFKVSINRSNNCFFARIDYVCTK